MVGHKDSVDSCAKPRLNHKRKRKAMLKRFSYRETKLSFRRGKL